MSASQATADPRAVQTGAAVAPAWRRARFWLALGGLLIVAAIVISLIKGSPADPLDPTSASKSGSKALATLLRDHGVTVHRVTSIADAQRAGGTVLVAFPVDYTKFQLDQLRTGVARQILISPDPRLLPDSLGLGGNNFPPAAPDCDWPGALAAGAVDFPSDTNTYQVSRGTAAAIDCYRGAVVQVDTLAVLGSADLLRNDHIAAPGAAALAINLISDNLTVRQVTWLMPGANAPGQPPASIWDLFPTGARRAAYWLLIVVGGLLMVWRGRRFGPVVSEPLPVVVRAAEVVEGHGRLYRRAGARDRAATALRAGATARLAARAGLTRNASSQDLVTAGATLSGRNPTDVAAVLDGPPPTDDSQLIALACRLDELERAAGVPPRTKGPTA